MIFYETASQPRELLLLLYAGAGVGVLYDLLSPARRWGPKGMSWAADFIWCLLSAALCFLALVMGGQGGVRFYTLLGAAGGALIYAMGVRRVIMDLFKRIKARLSGKHKQEKTAQTANATTKEKGA